MSAGIACTLKCFKKGFKRKKSICCILLKGKMVYITANWDFVIGIIDIIPYKNVLSL